MKKSLITLFTLSLVLISNPSFAKSKSFAVDADHTSVDFKIRHLVGKVKGSFAVTEGKVDYDADKVEKLKVNGKIDVNTIDTGVAKRDEHLKSADFFDVANAKHPEYKTITFESTKFSDVTTVGEEIKGKLEGKITIHGVTKPITLDVVMHKPILDPWGNDRTAISATGTLNRKDFGLNWNKAIETGGFVVGDDVEIALEVEAFTKAEVKKDAPKKDEKKVETPKADSDANASKK